MFDTRIQRAMSMFLASNLPSWAKRDDFDFDIVNFAFLDVPRSTSYGVFISQPIRFAIVSSYVTDFNARNKSLTAKLLQQGYRYHKLRKYFLSVAWPTGVQLLVFFCSSVPVVLFDTPGISRCRSQHVSVESSSLLHHSIYL